MSTVDSSRRREITYDTRIRGISLSCGGIHGCRHYHEAEIRSGGIRKMVGVVDSLVA